MSNACPSDPTRPCSIFRVRSKSVSYTAHPPPAERARIVPVPQGRTCCTTTWAALPVTTVRRQVMNARQTCRSSATSASTPIQDARIRPWTTRATTELVRWPRTSAVPAGTGLPQRPPRRASSCAVFGDVFKDGTTSWFTGSDTAIDMYIENTTYYPNWVRRTSPPLPPLPISRTPASVARTA